MSSEQASNAGATRIPRLTAPVEFRAIEHARGFHEVPAAVRSPRYIQSDPTSTAANMQLDQARFSAMAEPLSE